MHFVVVNKQARWSKPSLHSYLLQSRESASWGQSFLETLPRPSRLIFPQEECPRMIPKTEAIPRMVLQSPPILRWTLAKILFQNQRESSSRKPQNRSSTISLGMNNQPSMVSLLLWILQRNLFWEKQTRMLVSSWTETRKKKIKSKTRKKIKQMRMETWQPLSLSLSRYGK